MTDQHTPGPWVLDANADGWSLLAPEHDVCSFDASEADARLIASAPDLLAALEAVLRHFPYEWMNQGSRSIDDAYSAAEAAIRKARGEDACDGPYINTDRMVQH